MRQDHKKILKAIIGNEYDRTRDAVNAIMQSIEELKDEHENWMDERDYDTDGRFANTPTGERAEEEHNVLDDIFDRLDTIVTELDDIQSELDELI